MQRRQFITLFSGLAIGSRVQARPAVAESMIADLPRTEEALFELTQGARILPTTQIDLLALQSVEYAPRWPVRVVSRIPDTHWMALVLEQNPQPLAAVYRFKPGVVTETSGNFKLADSTQVIIVVAAAGQFYGLRRFITVVGNCV